MLDSPTGADEQPRCSDPVHWPLVDAAFERPGSPAAQLMRDTLCQGCPVGTKCLQWGMTHHESGIWGGAGPNSRTRRGAPAGPTTKYARRKATAA